VANLETPSRAVVRFHNYISSRGLQQQKLKYRVGLLGAKTEISVYTLAGSVVLDANSNVYGTTFCGAGVVFEIRSS
jgi:hypothetical protein